jgi:threonine dehydrogenase-like Zn-dependent dehydrogenase
MRRDRAKLLGFVVVDPTEAREGPAEAREGPAEAREGPAEAREGPAEAQRCDVLFDTAAVPSVAAATTGWVRSGGRIVLVGVYARPAPVDLQRVTFAELELVGTRVYRRDDLETAIRLLDRRAIDPEPLITRTVPLSAAGTALDLLRSGSGIKVLVEVAP